MKEPRAEALRTMTVTGQRLLQEPEAVSDDDDDDDSDDTVLGETRSEKSERVFFSHSQRDLVAQEVGVMHQVSRSSSVSTFCRNEIKGRNYKSVQQHIFTSFSFSGKKWLAPPYARCNFRWKFSTAPPKS